MEYKILAYQNALTLERHVNEHIALGWEPQGSLVVLERADQDSNWSCKSLWYAQAIVKE